jgi:hypothetical protein
VAQAFAALIFGVLSHGAAASLVEWTVQGLFIDGGSLTGSFVYDADTNVYSSWDILASASILGPPPSHNYLPSNSSTVGSSAAGVIFSAPADARTLSLGFNPALTNFGGLVDVSATEVFDSGSRFTFGAFAIGLPVAAIPEPSTYALMLAGLGLVGFVAHRRRKP